MMNNLSKTVSLGIVFLMTAVMTAGLEAGEISKTFKNIDLIRIKTVSGDCIVRKGQADKVKVELSFTFDTDDYEPEIEQAGKRLILSERFHGRSNRGRSTWRLAVPDNIRIDFSTSSGDFEASDITAELEAETASGDISLSHINGQIKGSTASGDVEVTHLQGNLDFGTASGDVELSDANGEIEIGTASGGIRAENLRGELDLGTASGRIVIEDATGEFDVGTASGRINARGIEVTAHSEFSAASGDVEVRLSKSPEHDLTLSSASGDAVLNFDSNPIKGRITMTAKVDRGRIRAPFKFDDEETFYKWDDEYVTKTVTKSGNRPRIKISTASGVAELIEN